MEIAVIHGYFLDDSGSAIYVRELCRNFVKQGYNVTLICQERNPQRYDFIDSFFVFDSSNEKLEKIYENKRKFAGSCRLVRPNINKKLLTYFPSPFEGFEAKTFQDSTNSEVGEYLELNIKAVTKIFEMWPPKFIQTNHVVMQPYIANKSIKGKCPYVVTVHGSALNFTVKKDDRFVPYAVEGLQNAKTVLSLSGNSQKEIEEFDEEHSIGISSKLKVISPGVDSDLFKPSSNRLGDLKEIGLEIEENDEIIVFAGRIIWTKGLQYLIAALPLIIEKYPNVKLIVAGEGPMADELNKLTLLIEEGDLKKINDFIEKAEHIKEEDGYSHILPSLDVEQKKKYKHFANNLSKKIFYMGHINHEKLSKLYGVADITVASSIFKEAFGLICIESLSGGALPIATYQSGFESTLDSIADLLQEPKIKDLKPPIRLTENIAENCDYFLKKPTKDYEFRSRLHEMAKEKFSWKKTVESYVEIAISEK